MVLKLCLVLLASASMAAGQTAGGGGTGVSTCQQAFMTELYKCIQNNELDVNNFLYMVTNATSGQAPDNSDTFKTSACAKEREIGACILNFMKILVNSSQCLPQNGQTDQRPMIGRQFISLGQAYDNKCAHPCRRSLINDLRECYQESKLDADLFLSNSSMSRGAVIGETDNEAHMFCENKETLISCMKRYRDDCPESPLVLGAIGLDIESMEEGVNILCQHIQVYLTGLDCFQEQTQDVEECAKVQIEKTFKLMQDIDSGALNASDSEGEFCTIRLNHIKCDLGAWRNKEHKSCTPAVLGLRNEVECELVADGCKSGELAKIANQMCNKEKYCRDCREGGGGAAATSASLTALLPVLVFAGLFLNF